MASGQRKRSGSGRKKTPGRSGAGRNGRRTRQAKPIDSAIKNEAVLIGVFALAVFLFLCNFGIVGTAGNIISDVMFGLLGIPAYIAPVLLFLAVAFGISNRGSMIAAGKLAAAVILFLIIGMVCDLAAGAWNENSVYQVKEIYERCSQNHSGGGVLAGTLAFLSFRSLSMVGTVLLLVVLTVICLVILTEKSFVRGVRNGGQKVYERTREETYARRERAQQRRQEQREMRRKREENRRIMEEEKEDEKILRMDKKVSGVMLDTTLSTEKKKPKKEVEKGAVTIEEAEAASVRDDIHEIILNDLDGDGAQTANVASEANAFMENIAVRSVESSAGLHSSEYDRIHITANGRTEGMEEGRRQETEAYRIEPTEIPTEVPTEIPVGEEIRERSSNRNTRIRPEARLPENGARAADEKKTPQDMEIQNKKEAVPKKYMFPSLNLLKKGENKGNAASSMQLKETAIHLQKTLATFGVKVTITDISQGPTVTRYELQPEQGVKVSKIVGLADDIKLNLAATDIRIEAPIPGKAAVGIEVPNKENSAVPLRDLLESGEFQSFPSNLSFAVGKDIGGKTVVADIAKMPHMLIAGSTGSGKSVCINTLIMSILYKAHPDDVKLIMVDPKADG